MNVIFISPQFPTYYYNFCDRLKERGANVLGIGDTPYDMISDETKLSLNEYYYVDSLEDYEQVFRATAYFISRYGKIDWIESENEYWLETEAQLRTDFNVTTGPKADEIAFQRHKSKMKELYEKGGVNVAKWILLTDLDKGLALGEEIGYPLIAKPDDGMGASDTHKIHDAEELKAFYDTKDPDVTYILEDFVPGHVETFEGITDSNCNIFVATSHVMTYAVMDMVNEKLDSTFYSQPVAGRDIYDIGEKTVKAFNAKSRFFHFEFMRLDEDHGYLGNKGDLVGLEVNMRAPGAYIPEMMNFCYDIDIYTIWADMVLYDKCFFDIERKYYVAYAGRRNGREYKMSSWDIRHEFKDDIMLETDVPEVLAEAMSDHVFIYRTKTKEDMHRIGRMMLAHKNDDTVYPDILDTEEAEKLRG